MNGIDRTYHLLATTSNRAAIAVLADGLLSKSPSIRSIALSCLVERSEPEATDLLLAHWGALSAEDHRSIEGQANRIGKAAARCFANNKLVPSAIAACSALKLYDQVDALATLAENPGGLSIARSATDALIEMSKPIGSEARLDRPVWAIRGRFIHRLSESVSRFSQHRNKSLIDAFLIASTWSDAPLRAWVSGDDAISRLVQRRLHACESVGIVELLAGYLQRRRIPDAVTRSLANHESDSVASAILRTIGNSPTIATRANLKTIGVPKSLAGGVDRCVDIIPANRSAMVHAYSAAGKSFEEILSVLLFAIHHWKQPDVVAAVALALSRCPIASKQWMMRAAIAVSKLLDGSGPADVEQSVAETNPRSLESLGSNSLPDPASKIVAQLIDLLSHHDAAVAMGARRMLTPLHAESLLASFDNLRERSRRSLGRIVMRIDPQAINRVRDALRHPVMERRLEAIASADALSAVELLGNSFIRIAREDHQAARVRAAKAMGNATDALTYSLLEEMLELPESQVRDAAQAALAIRRRGDSTKSPVDGAKAIAKFSAAIATVTPTMENSP